VVQSSLGPARRAVSEGGAEGPTGEANEGPGEAIGAQIDEVGAVDGAREEAAEGGDGAEEGLAEAELGGEKVGKGLVGEGDSRYTEGVG
jgi:hypothetical protein